MTQPLAPSHKLLLCVDDAKTITAKSRSNFSSAFLFLPQEKRLAIQRVYAFFRVIDDIVDEPGELKAQRELLDSWKKELRQAYRGLTIVPLLKELKESIDRFSIPQNYFIKLIEGCEMDLTVSRYRTFGELYEYCYRVASMVGLTCMRIFEYESPTADETAVALGMALQLTNIIRDVGVDLEKSRIYLPLEDLRRFGISERDIMTRRPDPALFILLMDFQYERALGYYDKGASEFRNDAEGRLLAARIMATVYRRILEKIRTAHYPVLSRRVRLNLFEKLFILARTLWKHSRRAA